MRLILLLLSSALLSACYFGNGRICGPQTPIGYCIPKPPVTDYLKYWHKPNTTDAQKLADALGCDKDFLSKEAARGYASLLLDSNERSKIVAKEGIDRAIVIAKEMQNTFNRCYLQLGYELTDSHWCQSNHKSTDPLCTPEQIQKREARLGRKQAD